MTGAFVGIAFHFLLSLHPHRGLFSFSATLLPLFWLFLPRERIERFSVPTWTRRAVQTFAIVVGGAYVAVQALRRSGDDGLFRPVALYGLWIWLPYVVLITGVFVANLRRTRGVAASVGTELRPRAPGFLLVPALAVVNGICPYLGFKTESSFSMFANLRTECGRGNHILVPDGTQLTGWLEDPVRLLACSDPELVRLRDQRYGITYFQLRVLRSREKRRFAATFVRDGETVEFDSARPETASALPPVPWIVTKLCQFRPIDLDERVRPRH